MEQRAAVVVVLAVCSLLAVCSVLLTLRGGSAILQSNTSIQHQQQNHPSDPTARSDDAHLLPTIVLTTNNKAGYGNQLQNVWHLLALVQCLGGDTKVAFPGVTTHKDPFVGRPPPDYLSDSGMSLYDNDIVRNELGVHVTHFRSECACFDYVLTPLDPVNRKRLDGSRWNLSLYDPVEPEYHATWRELHFAPPKTKTRTKQRGLSVNISNSGDDADSYSAWDVFPEERGRLVSGHAVESECGNSARCVFVHTRDLIDLLNEIETALPRQCSAKNIVRFREAARKRVLPGKLLVEASRAVLPVWMKPKETLIVHLRYESGEYMMHQDLCQTSHAVCLGRSGQYSVVDMREFGRLMKELAATLGCKHVFPILPRQFMSEELVDAVAGQFGLSVDDLVSSRDLMEISVMLFERTLAVISRGFVAETKQTSFSWTIGHQRAALGLSDVVSIERVTAKSALSVASLRSAHGENAGAAFKALVAAGAATAESRAKQTVSIDDLLAQ